MLPQAANVPLPAGARAGPPGAVGPPASRDLYRSFADLLEYPTPDLAGKVQACCLQLTDSEPPAAELMQGFLCSVEQTPLARLEEIFSATFDLQAVCYPYVGYHLFGDSYKRAQFMARLNEG
jgi:nitrate reductase delta subunit